MSTARLRENMMEAPLVEWSAARVAGWLREMGQPAALADAVIAADVDGATVAEMDADAWLELGVSSALARAKLISQIKRMATVGGGDMAQIPPAGQAPPPGLPTRDALVGEQLTSESHSEAPMAMAGDVQRGSALSRIRRQSESMVTNLMGGSKVAQTPTDGPAPNSSPLDSPPRSNGNPWSEPSMDSNPWATPVADSMTPAISAHRAAATSSFTGVPTQLPVSTGGSTEKLVNESAGSTTASMEQQQAGSRAAEMDPDELLCGWLQKRDPSVFSNAVKWRYWVSSSLALLLMTSQPSPPACPSLQPQLQPPQCLLIPSTQHPTP